MATLLDAGANVVCADRNGCTALHKAGRSGVGSAVRLLLDAGADVAAVDKLRSTALHEAASAGRRGALTSLCKAGASTEARDSSGRAPLHIAAESGSAAVVIALLPFTLSPGAPGHDNGGGLHGAPAGQVPEGDVPESLGFGVNAVDHDGQTPVHFAAFNGHAEVVAMLLHHGAFPEVVNVMGLTPLSIAASLGHGGIVDQLGPAHPSGAVSTPLHGAVKYGRLALLAKPQLRPFLHAADEAGSTALHLAASAVDAPAVRILMGLNSNVLRHTSGGTGPVGSAALPPTLRGTVNMCIAKQLSTYLRHSQRRVDCLLKALPNEGKERKRRAKRHLG